jgi:hypothetical protein
MQELTVCINHFNKFGTVSKTMASVPDGYHVLVMDGGSNPENVQSMQRHCEEVGAAFYHYVYPNSAGNFNQVNMQIYGMKNYALQFVKTPYVAFNDGDFVYENAALMESLVAYRQLPKIGMLGYYLPRIARVRTWGNSPEWPDPLVWGHMAIGCANVMIKDDIVGFTEVNTVGGMVTLHSTEQLKSVGGWPIPPYPRQKCPPGVCGDGDGCLSEIVHQAGLKMYIPTERVWGHELYE